MTKYLFIALIIMGSVVSVISFVMWNHEVQFWLVGIWALNSVIVTINNMLLRKYQDKEF